ncbi:MAG: hypothetical protein MUP36_01740 [Demequinaceae bacterium]|nr:hypothetical protein [Demequinaceae bacterium]
MKNVADRSLAIGAVLIGLIIAVATWFLVISPKLSSAQEAREATVAQLDTNGMLEITILERQEDAKEVPANIREIHAIRDILPPSEDVPALRRELDALVSAAGLTIDKESLSPPVALLGGLSLAAQMEQEGLTSQIEGMIFTSEVGALVAPSLLGVEFKLEVVGEWAKAYDLIDSIQVGDHQYILIRSLSMTRESEIRTSISGMYFILDKDDPDIVVRPEERPWPSTEEDEASDSPDEPVE